VLEKNHVQQAYLACDDNPVTKSISGVPYTKGVASTPIVFPMTNSPGPKDDGPKHVEEVLTREHFEDSTQVEIWLKMIKPLMYG
jgi:hypothetical protein